MKETLIEVCRSFSQKVGNPKKQYENVDFFCSAKREIPLKEAEKTSKELSELVKGEVEGSVKAYKDAFDREVTYESISAKPATPEEEEQLDREAERIKAEGISEQEKLNLDEREGKTEQ
jgi:hypothetical protein